MTQGGNAVRPDEEQASALRGRRVLVTGAAGFIGANLVRDLVARGARVTAIVRPETNPWRIAEVMPQIALRRVDVTERGATLATVREARPDVIFHLATRGITAAKRNSWDIVAPNVLGTAHLLEAAETPGCDRFVHVGSSTAYGHGAAPLTEGDPADPVTLYGATKAAAEVLCRQAAHAGRPVVVLRPFSVYGPWEAGHRLIPTAVLAALRGTGMALTAGSFRRDLVFVDDVVEACRLAATCPGAAGEVVNVGTGRQWTPREVVCLVESVSGRRVAVRADAFPPRPGDAECWVADATKARTLLGWEPRHDLESGLRRTVTWFRDHAGAYADPAAGVGERP